MRHRSILIAALTVALAGASGSPTRILITAPRDGARPRSAYLAMEGTGPPLSRLDVLADGLLLRTTETAADGHFDCVLKLAPGEHEIMVRSGPSAVSAAVHVTIATGFAPPRSPAAYDQLREGDVLFGHASQSEQVQIYNPVYTHTSLYAGPDADGTPMVLEPVSQQGDIEGGVVALVPLEQTVIWHEDRAAIYRADGGLQPDERRSLMSWAQTTAAREVPFTINDDFAYVFRAWLLWDRRLDRPLDPARFNRLLAVIHARTLETNRFNCASLVWRGFFDATRGRVDLSRPNRALLQALARRLSRRFVAAVQPVLLLPDTLAFCGKLEQVQR